MKSNGANSRLKQLHERKRQHPCNPIAQAYDPSGVTPEDEKDYADINRQIKELEDPKTWQSLVEDGADIMRLELPPVVELVAGLLTPCAKFVIASNSKSFKTWLTMFMALSIAAGVKFWGRDTTRKRVLYVNLELKRATFQRRVQIIAGKAGLKLEPSWFSHIALRGKLGGLSVLQVVERIIAEARRLNAEVVILDPIYKLTFEGKENDTGDTTVLYNLLDRITTEAAATVILCDHFGKGDQSMKEPLDAIRGSSAKGGDVDAAMVLRKHDITDCFRVDVVHRELAPIAPFVVGWQFPFMLIRPDLDPENMKKAGPGRREEYEPKKLLGVILDTSQEKTISVSGWGVRANIPRKTMADYASRYRVKGWVGTIGEGVKVRLYITEEGRKIAA